MICELFERDDGSWSFRFVFANGRKAGHLYRDATDAARGAHDLITAIRSEGDGIEFREVRHIATIPTDPEGA